MAGKDFEPYTYTKTYTLVPTSANADRQLMRASWPINMYAELESLTVTGNIASAGQVIIWDQDLSNTGPTSRGSAGGALQTFGVPAGAVSGVAATTTVYNEEGNAPKIVAYAGFAVQASLLNTQIVAKIRHRR